MGSIIKELSLFPLQFGSLEDSVLKSTRKELFGIVAQESMPCQLTMSDEALVSLKIRRNAPNVVLLLTNRMETAQIR